MLAAGTTREVAHRVPGFVELSPSLPRTRACWPGLRAVLEAKPKVTTNSKAKAKATSKSKATAKAKRCPPFYGAW